MDGEKYLIWAKVKHHLEANQDDFYLEHSELVNLVRPPEFIYPEADKVVDFVEIYDSVFMNTWCPDSIIQRFYINTDTPNELSVFLILQIFFIENIVLNLTYSARMALDVIAYDSQIPFLVWEFGQGLEDLVLQILTKLSFQLRLLNFLIKAFVNMEQVGLPFLLKEQLMSLGCKIFLNLSPSDVGVKLLSFGTDWNLVGLLIWIFEHFSIINKIYFASF